MKKLVIRVGDDIMLRQVIKEKHKDLLVVAPKYSCGIRYCLFGSRN